MLKRLLFVSACFFALHCTAQSKQSYNLDFEEVDQVKKVPVGWGWGNISTAAIPDDSTRLLYRLDEKNKQSGKYSLLIDWTTSPKRWTAVNYRINEHFKGKRIKLTGYAKTENVEDWAGLWLRVDGYDGKSIEFDNMQDRPITGTTGWKQYSISLDYDEIKSKRIVFGGLIEGKGKLWLDNFHLLVDGKEMAEAEVLKEVTLDTMSVSAPAGQPPYRPSSPKTWEILNTRVALDFDWKGKTADAREWIKLRPYFYNTDSVVLDAKGMRIDSVLLTGKKGNTRLMYVYNNDKLSIHFNKQYLPTDTIELHLKYRAMPYTGPTGGSGAITDDRGLYFINTDYSVPNKPSQIWTQGETESNSHWMITIDKPNTRFTTQIELNVPDSMVTLSNGALLKQVKGVKGMRTDIWRMDQPIQAYAVMFAIGKFSIVKDKWKNKEVNYYVEPAYAPYASLIFKHTPEMMEYFSQRTGVSYPWNKYSQVIVRDYVSGAMENTSATLCGELLNQNAREIADNDREDIVSHELFHQWFGDYVTCESWSNITVNESFANYGEQLWRAHKYGKASGDELAYNDLQGYIGSSQINDPQLVRFNYDSREDVFDAISYNKGGAILRYLNNLLGDAAFDRAMNTYLTRNALHSAEAHNWRMAVEEATGLDWNWFFNQWYYHAGHPVVKVTYNYSDSLQQLIVYANQTQSDSLYDYHLPLKTAVIYGNDKTIIDWNLTKRKDTFVYAYKNGVKPVIVPDCAHVLPGEMKDGKKPEQWLLQYTNSDDYVGKRLALSAAGRALSDSISQVIIDMALSDPMSTIRKNALAILNNATSDKYHKRWTSKVLDMAVTDTNRLVRAEALEILGSWKATAAKPIFVKAVSDSSYAVAGAALASLNKLDADTAYILAKMLVNTNPKTTLESTIWSIIGKKGEDADIALFTAHAPYVTGAKKFTFGPALTSYLKIVKSDASFNAGVNTFTTLVINENMKQYRSAIGGFLFQLEGDELDNSKSDKVEESELAKRRVEIVKVALQKIIAAEQDTETKTEFEKKMKDTFE